MPLPLVQRCGPLSLETGCLILCFISTLACVGNITAGAWKMPVYRTREPEDNLISMSMMMFSSLSAVGNIVAIFGIWLKRPGYLQLSIVFNSVLILCIFLVAVVTCIFRLDEYFQNPGYVVLAILLLLLGAAYSFYYLVVVNSLYRIMKMSYCETTIPF